MSDGRSEELSKVVKQSWKKKSPTSPVAGGGKYWATGAGHKSMVSGSLVRLFLALTVLLITTASLVVYLWNQNSSTPFISIAAIDYEHPWAPNAWAKEDQKRFQALAESSQFKVAVKQERKEGTWQDLIDLELEKVTPGGPGGSLIPFLFGYRSLIIHLSAHGVLNGQGQPCLLFADADPLDDQTWVPLVQVLEAIGEHAVVSHNHARVLVILDTGKQPPDFRCGLLTCGFIDAAREQIRTLPFSNFAVLLSCAESQTAWTAPEIQGTVFGFMVAAGLQGAADELFGNGNQRVTVQELAGFVAETVDGYVREHRGRVQNPGLVWSGESQENDFELCFQSNYSSTAGASYQPNTRLTRMSEAWSSFEQWNKRTPSYATWQRAAVLARLARAEQLMWAGSAYEDQFEQEIARAEKGFLGTATSPWPDAICGSSLAFLDRVHGRQAGLGLGTGASSGPARAAGRPVASLAVGQAPTAARANPELASSSGGASANVSGTASNDARTKDGSSSSQPTPEVTASSSGPQNSDSPNTAAAPAQAKASDTNTGSATPAAPVLDAAQMIVAWLTFDGPPVEGQPPPERPQSLSRPTAVRFVYSWLADNPQSVNRNTLSRCLEWIGPIAEPQSVTREEALLRTIYEHLRLASDWEKPAAERLGQLWSQYLVAAAACESAIATVDPRATSCLESSASKLLVDEQLVRDRILGCETARDASDCAIDVESLQIAAKQVNEIRDRLERAWRLRDELASELPTLAQWIASPIARLQTVLSTTAAWDISQKLIQQLDALHVQLAAGKVPDASQMDDLEQRFDRLVSAYSRSIYDLTDVSAKGQRRPLGNLMLSLGLRPNIYRGLQLADRGRVHQGLDSRYRDFKDTVSHEKLVAYSQRLQTEGVDSGLVWQTNDLPADLAACFVPVAFSQSALSRSLVSPDAVAPSGSNRLAAIGAELRSVWSDIPPGLVQQSQAAIKSMDSQDQAVIEEAHQRLMKAEHTAHLLGQLVPAEQLFVQPDPATLVQSVCIEQYALWQARRALLDFWQTPELPEAFMLASSRAWQAIAARLPARGPLAIVEHLHQSSAEVAASWRDVLQNLQAGTSPENLWQAKLALANFPAGRAWLQLALDGNMSHLQPLQGKRFQLEMGTGGLASDANRFSLVTTDLPEGNHELVAWFRGHTARAPVPVYRQQPPVTLAWQAEPVGDTTIRVNADPKPARIVFVLDCSGSMTDDGMQTAKSTLLDAIRELGRLPAGRVEIAVVLFGHTAEYSKVNQDEFSKWPGKRNRPYSDVEVIQALASPTPAVISGLQLVLSNLRCWGRTPLYEAIRQSVDLLLHRHDGFTGDLRVVVITDGDDNVFPFATGKAGNATATGNFLVPNQFIHTEQSAIDLAKGQVSLDFIAFNFQGGAGGGSAKLETMARQTGGKVYRAGAQNLAAQLHNSIVRDTYSTQSLETGRTIGSTVRVSDELHIEPSLIPGEFEVQIDNTSVRKTVALLGGETIEMQYRRQQGLSFLPHDEGDAFPEPGEFSYADRPYQAIMLIGKPDSVPQVHMCLQSIDLSKQSIRPERFLLEVRRVRAGESGGERIAWTSDALWESNHRSPVLRVVIKNLPDLQRDRLETRLWVAPFGSQTTSQPLPVARFKEQAVQVATGVSVSAETRTEAGGLRLTLTETRQAGAPLIHWLVSPQADKLVEHQIYDKRVVHEFFYTDAHVLNQIELVATPLESSPLNNATSDGWQATQWLRVPGWK